MKGQPNRLVADAGRHHLQGSAIDRNQPLQFRLDGRIIYGLCRRHGAQRVLASGIDTVGQRDETPLALSAAACADHQFAALAGDHQRALPMERTLATDGADYITLPARERRRSAGCGAPAAARRRVARYRPRPSRGPGASLARQPRRSRARAADLVVVGGGVAGLSAALAAAKARSAGRADRSLPERWAACRGCSARSRARRRQTRAIARLTAAIAKSDAITVLTRAEVFALRPGVVRLHRRRDARRPARRPRHRCHAPHIVLATGSLERLPIFPGNRLPGVIGALEAFELAHLYGVWPARRRWSPPVAARPIGWPCWPAMLASPCPASSTAARIRSRASSNSPRPMASRWRPGPSSRLPPRRPRDAASSSRPQLAMEDFARTEPALAVDRLIACGGWQPDLTLWHMAGGESRWNAAAARLEPTHRPSRRRAGRQRRRLSQPPRLPRQRRRRRRCFCSAGRAGRVEELIIDPIYETPDAPASGRPAASDEPAAPAYLDAGRRYIERPSGRQHRAGRPGCPLRPKPAGWSLADTPQPLDVADIAAGVQLGAIPAASAGIVAQERVAMVAIAIAPTDSPRQSARPPLPLVPGFLARPFWHRARSSG